MSQRLCVMLVGRSTHNLLTGPSWLFTAAQIWKYGGGHGTTAKCCIWHIRRYKFNNLNDSPSNAWHMVHMEKIFIFKNLYSLWDKNLYAAFIHFISVLKIKLSKTDPFELYWIPLHWKKSKIVLSSKLFNWYGLITLRHRWNITTASNIHDRKIK